ncbi:hypothetical protein [Moorena sp. SIO1G6]|nr:hypothetical protein [Moorena sp. SIO1G6]
MPNIDTGILPDIDTGKMPDIDTGKMPVLQDFLPLASYSAMHLDV